MLAIGRALMTNPRLLILDEATEGLAPVIRQEIWRAIGQLKAEGLAILVIDKNLQELLPLADRCVVLEKGRTVWAGARPRSRPIGAAGPLASGSDRMQQHRPPKILIASPLEPATVQPARSRALGYGASVGPPAGGHASGSVIAETILLPIGLGHIGSLSAPSSGSSA